MVTDYEGLVSLNGTFFSTFVMTNSGNLTNRIDIFAIANQLVVGGAVPSQRIEINYAPLTPFQMMALRRERPRPRPSP